VRVSHRKRLEYYETRAFPVSADLVVRGFGRTYLAYSSVEVGRTSVGDSTEGAA